MYAFACCSLVYALCCQITRKLLWNLEVERRSDMWRTNRRDWIDHLIYIHKFSAPVNEKTLCASQRAEECTAENLSFELWLEMDARDDVRGLPQRPLHRTLPRPRRDSQAVARPSNRFSGGVLVVFVPVWFRATFRKPWTDAKTNKQITENILHGRRERDRERHLEKSVPRRVRGQRFAHLVDPSSLDRWPKGEVSRLGHNRISPINSRKWRCHNGCFLDFLG